MFLRTLIFANCTIAVIIAMIIAKVKEIIVRGIVVINPGSSILGKESIKSFTRLSVISPSIIL